MRILSISFLLLMTALAGCTDTGTAPGDDLSRSTADTDSDGVTDAVEVAVGTDPFDSADNPGVRASLLAGPYVGSHPGYGFATYGSTTTDVDAWAPPVPHEIPDASEFGIGSLTHLAHVDGLGAEGAQVEGDDVKAGGGSGIAVFGHLAFVGPSGGPMSIVDISDPLAPVILSTIEGVPARDIDTIAYPDGRLVTVSTNGGGNVPVTDVTDPENPVVLSRLEVAYGAHNLAVVPGTPIFYNSVSSGEAMDIWDLSDPANPVMAANVEEGLDGCHDITFYITADKQRAYCAGIGNTEIWDISDPKAPTVIADFPLPVDKHPLSISHLAMVNHDASVLIVGDETGGGAAPACDYYYENPATGETASGDGGNLWFYDLSDETDPVFVSQLSASAYDSHATCTSHFGKLVEDTNHMVIAFYGAGVLLVDFTDIDNPRIVDKWRASTDATSPALTWDAWYYQGYVITGDITRGMDILQLDAAIADVPV